MDSLHISKRKNEREAKKEQQINEKEHGIIIIEFMFDPIIRNAYLHTLSLHMKLVRSWKKNYHLFSSYQFPIPTTMNGFREVVFNNFP